MSRDGWLPPGVNYSDLDPPGLPPGAEVARGDLIVGARVSDLPEPYVPSLEHTCERCEEAIWLSRSWPGEWLEIGYVVCLPCVIEIAEEVGLL